VSSFGVIPKWGQVGKWRLIVDLSSPTGSSVNDGINPEEFTLHYVESAYRNVLVHPLDHYLLGMKWCSHYYIDLTLPVGLHSAPFIFNTIAEMVEWILMHPYQISTLLHYLDDFITAGPPDSPQCAHNLSTTLAVCKQLGLPLHPGKCEGPATVLVVLGIELDLVNSKLPVCQQKSY